MSVVLGGIGLLLFGALCVLIWLAIARYRLPRWDSVYCIREDGHEPPCNGLPRAQCPNLADPLDDTYTGEHAGFG